MTALQETVELVTGNLTELGVMTDNLNVTAIGYGETIDKIEGNLDKLEETLDKGSSDVEQLKTEIDDIQPKLEKTMKKEQDVVNEINKKWMK